MCTRLPASWWDDRDVRTGAALTAVASLFALAACTSAPGVACTEIGAPSGVGVTVLAPYAEQVDGLRLEVCWTEPCTEDTVELAPGSDTIDQGCSGPDPDDTCSATAVPNGTLVGFLPVLELPAAEVTVGGTVTVAGRAVELAAVTRTAETTYPNGTQCPPGGNQLAVVIDKDGIR
jgi:hypothetical protein